MFEQIHSYIVWWKGPSAELSLMGFPARGNSNYSRVHISSDEAFSKILKEPSIVQKKMIPHMNGLHVFIDMKQKKKILFEKSPRFLIALPILKSTNMSFFKPETP